MAGGAETQRYAYLNTGLAGSVSSGAGTGGGYYETSHTTYGYDARGLKTSEYATDTTHGVIENATATWDALGRMASWAEAGNATTPAADQAWSYDAVGNVRRRTGHSNWLSVFGAPVYGSPLTSNSAIYQYDAMNRMTGGNGVAVTYNAAGQRMTATGYATLTVTIANPNYDPEQPNKPGNRPTITIPITVPTLEHYAYDTAGNLASVRIAQGAWEDNGAGGVYTYAPTGAGALKSTFGYDGMGRQVRQQDWTGDGSGVAYDRQVTYDAKGRVSYETDVQKQGNDTYTSYVSNAFADGGGTAYALGAATSSTNASYKNGAYQATASTATSYAWYDAAVQSQVDYSPGTGGTYHTWYTNSATGVLQSASVQDGRPRSISLTNDALGQALRRDEADNTASTGDPHELWYRFNGKQIGYIGNNDTDNIGYAASLQRRVTANVAGPFKNGQTYGAGIVEFDQAYDAINSYQQGAGGGSYTVRDGDSLSGIAAQLWGDAGLWYKLAQANGLSGDTALAAGQTLSVPAGVVRSSNTAGTFRPYDISQAYGDSSPTTPSPQAAKKNKCGAFGAILLVAIAVAVTALTQGAAIGAVSPLFGHAGAVAVGSALAGVAGSVASQAVGLATGIQDKFDWKGVALAGTGAGIGGALGSVMPGGGAVGAIERGVLGSALTQGIGVATGLQSKFDWAGVAAAGIGAGAGQALGGKLDGLGKFGARLAANTTGGIANAATRSLVNGTDFGDNLIAALPDIIGQTVGSWAAGEIRGGGGNRAAALAASAKGGSVLNESDLNYNYGSITEIDSDLLAELFGPATSNPAEVRRQASMAAWKDWTSAHGDPSATAVGGSSTELEMTVAGAGLNSLKMNGEDRIAFLLYGSGTKDFSINGFFGLQSDRYDTSSAGMTAYAQAVVDQSERQGGYWSVVNFIGPAFADAASANPNMAGAAQVFEKYAALTRTRGDNADKELVVAFAKSQGEAAKAFIPIVAAGDVARKVATGEKFQWTDGVALIPVIGKGAMVIGGIRKGLEVESAIARATRLGREGETAAGIAGPKSGILMASGKMRFPDQVTRTIVKEVKNVGKQGWTGQLKDYAAYAKSTGRTFELWVRENTVLSRELEAASRREEVIIKRGRPAR